MADVVDVRTRQSMAIEFFTVEGANPIEIHRRLRSVNGEDAIDVSSVGHWVSLFKKSEKNVGDWPHSGRPATAATTKTKVRVDVNFVPRLTIESSFFPTRFSKLARDI